MTTYLQKLQKNNYTPNFFCSEDYFLYAGWKEDVFGNYLSIHDGLYNMLPVLFRGEVNHYLKCWSTIISPAIINKFLDYNFTYDPKEFLNLSGGKKESFRKNIRKFPKVAGNLQYIRLNKSDHALNSFVNWLMGKPENETIEDSDTIINYLKNHKDVKILLDENKFYGVNVWDENYKYVNFRYSFCENTPYLSEYMRYIFYTDPEILNKNKEVNDGGCLGKESLYFFKCKLNPLHIYPIGTNL